MAEESYYDVLGVNKDATADDIKKQWKLLSRKYHPDKLPDEKKEWGENMFKKVTDAYRVLSDTGKRNRYDAEQSGGNASDIFSQFFGGFGDMFGRKQRDPVVIINITLEELFIGVVKHKSITFFDGKCGICNGSGGKNGQSVKCTVCNRGKIIRNVQISHDFVQRMVSECNECGGTMINRKSPNICTDCKGTGSKEQEFNVSFHVTRGMRDDSSYASEAIKDGRKRGVTVKLQVQNHATYKTKFGFKGVSNSNNMFREIDITIADSLCGFRKELEHPSGSGLIVARDAITSGRDMYIIYGKGLPIDETSYGDLIVKFNVLFPESIGSKRRLFKLLTGEKYHRINLDKSVSLVNIEEYEQNEEEEKDCRMQ